MTEYKGYRLQNDNFQQIHISNIAGKGVIPASLRGVFTTPRFAMQAIDAHVALKGDKDVKTDSAS